MVEVPSEAYLDALLDIPAFDQHQQQCRVTCATPMAAEVVVHFTPSVVMGNAKYQEWMSMFPASTNHIVINDVSSCLGLVEVHAIQHKLNLLSNKYFPLLNDRSIPVIQEDVSSKNKIGDEMESEFQDCRTSNSIHQAYTNLTYHIRPNTKFDW